MILFTLFLAFRLCINHVDQLRDELSKEHSKDFVRQNKTTLIQLTTNLPKNLLGKSATTIQVLSSAPFLDANCALLVDDV